MNEAQIVRLLAARHILVSGFLIRELLVVSRFLSDEEIIGLINNLEGGISRFDKVFTATQADRR